MRNIALRLFARSRLVLSEAGLADAPALAALHAGSFQHAWTDGEFIELLSQPNVLAHRAVVGGCVTGFILSRMISGEAEILSMAVTSTQRRRGLGRQLLHLHLRRLAGLGIGPVFLEVAEDNLPGRRLYRGAGFRDVGRREAYYPERKASAALVLRRDLP
jgi:ribosomal-protein-alanine N-acetyltransferase